MCIPVQSTFQIWCFRCLELDREICSDLGAPLVWIQPQLDGKVSLLGQCRQRDQNVLYLTGGSGNNVDRKIIDSMHGVLRHWLRALGIVKDVLLHLQIRLV